MSLLGRTAWTTSLSLRAQIVGMAFLSCVRGFEVVLAIENAQTYLVVIGS